MKRFGVGLIATAILKLAFGADADEPDDVELIRNARADSNDAIARHDVAGIVSHLDEDYQVTTSLGQLLQRPNGETDSWQQLIATRENLKYVRTPESIEISDGYPLAAETGTWIGSWSAADGEVRTGGRYAAMWRKVDGAWKIRSELFVALYCDGASCPALE